MQKFKKALRGLLYILLIVLAGFGIGLTGGVPIIPTMGKKDEEEVNVELVEGEDQLNQKEVKP